MDFKVCFGADIRSEILDEAHQNLNFTLLVATVRNRFGDFDFDIKWKDHEDDYITVTGDQDVRNAVKSMKKSKTTPKFYVIVADDFSLHSEVQPADDHSMNHSVSDVFQKFRGELMNADDSLLLRNQAALPGTLCENAIVVFVLTYRHTGHFS